MSTSSKMKHFLFFKYYLLCNHRDTKGFYSWYEATAVIEFNGRLSTNGLSEGHYTCDVKESTSNMWFRTNDNCLPTQIDPQDVSKYGYVVLFKRVN